jgi:hypothetical protein
MEFDDEIRGATPSWIVSVLKVGADDASSGNSEKPISPRMFDEGKLGCRKEGSVCLRLADDGWMDMRL